MDKIIHNAQAPAYIDNPINLDRALQEIQRALATRLPWLSVAYGRAKVIPEKLVDKTVSLPKVYYGGNEYQNIFTNDNHAATSWFQVTGPEVPLDYAPLNQTQRYQAPVSLIVWLNLDKVRLDLTNEDYHHLELPKREVHNVINRYPNLTLVRVYDENARDIFKEYTFEVEKDQFLTHPKAGLRFDFLLTYLYDCV